MWNGSELMRVNCGPTGFAGGVAPPSWFEDGCDDEDPEQPVRPSVNASTEERILRPWKVSTFSSSIRSNPWTCQGSTGAGKGRQFHHQRPHHKTSTLLLLAPL